MMYQDVPRRVVVCVYGSGCVCVGNCDAVCTLRHLVLWRCAAAVLGLVWCGLVWFGVVSLTKHVRMCVCVCAFVCAHTSEGGRRNF